MDVPQAALVWKRTLWHEGGHTSHPSAPRLEMWSACVCLFLQYMAPSVFASASLSIDWSAGKPLSLSSALPFVPGYRCPFLVEAIYLPIYLKTGPGVSNYRRIYLSTYLPGLSAYLTPYPPTYLFVYLSIDLSIHLTICLSMALSILPILSILTTYLSIDLYIYWCVHTYIRNAYTMQIRDRERVYIYIYIYSDKYTCLYLYLHYVMLHKT